MSGTPARLLIVGGGPRAAGILERIQANVGLLAGSRLDIDVADPHVPGAGRIWRPDQSPMLLMNSHAEDVSVFTDDSVECAGPVRPGPDLHQWARSVSTGEITLPDVDDDLRKEIAGLQPKSFASRRLLSQYLSWFYATTVTGFPDSVTVTPHTQLVTSVTPDGRGYRAELADGTVLDADAVVLSLGHTDAADSPRASALSDFAERHRLFYSPPAQSHELDLSPAGAGEDVLISGMGLAFIDVMSQLSEGRGGVFHPDPRPGDPDRLRYQPSGQEPRMWVGSRRGVPYHSKITAELRGEFSPAMTFLTRDYVDGLPGAINFRRDLLPVITAECEYFVYREILTGHPEWSAMDWAEFAPRFRAAVTAGVDRSDLIAEAVPDPRLHLDLARLDKPFAGEIFATLADVEAALLDYVSEDLRLATSEDHSEKQALFLAILHVHMQLARIVPLERLDVDSRQDFPDRWQSFFSLLDSGPPPHRLHQLLALHRAGLLRFLGPGVTVTADPAAGTFTAVSAHSPLRVSARNYIDAFLPPQVVEGTANPLIAQLIDDGVAREERVVSADGDTGTGRLSIDARYHLLRPGGDAHERIWAAGPTSSEIPLGAFSRPHTNAAPFQRNDAMARDILRSVRPGTAGATRERPVRIAAGVCR